jgi:alpha-tubulin suppressor-like RCC1 family protein
MIRLVALLLAYTGGKHHFENCNLYQAFCASCAVPDLLLWGSNTNGALGDNTVTSRANPVALTGLGNVTYVACGGDFAVALNTDGVLYSWGSPNAYGNIFQKSYSL